MSMLGALGMKSVLVAGAIANHFAAVEPEAAPQRENPPARSGQVMLDPGAGILQYLIEVEAGGPDITLQWL